MGNDVFEANRLSRYQLKPHYLQVLEEVVVVKWKTSTFYRA
ncbi:MAG: hypothetical protein ACUVUS_07210 [Thermoproteota archaeon]